MRIKSRKFISNGFTLIELILTLAIIAILMSIAVPIYSNYVTKAHRKEAQIALTELAADLEQYYMQHHTYQNAASELLKSDQTPGGQYKLSIKNSTDTDYLLQAIPQGSQAKNDKACGTLELNQLGQKLVAGSGDAKSCWG